MTITRSLRIAAPIDEVWTALARFDDISSWAPNVDHSSWASTLQSGVGAVRRVQVGRVTLLEKILDWETDAVLRYSIVGLPPVAGDVVTTWRLTADGDATTTTITTTIEPSPGPPGKIAARIVGRRMASAADQMLRGLAEQVTNAATTAKESS